MCREPDALHRLFFVVAVGLVGSVLTAVLQALDHSFRVDDVYDTLLALDT